MTCAGCVLEEAAVYRTIFVHVGALAGESSG